MYSQGIKFKYRVHKIDLSFGYISCLYCGILLIKMKTTVLHFTSSAIKYNSYKFEKYESLFRARLIFGLMEIVINFEVVIFRNETSGKFCAKNCNFCPNNYFSSARNRNLFNSCSINTRRCYFTSF